MYCENCGNQLSEDVKFCSKCGQELKKEKDPSDEGAVDLRPFSKKSTKENIEEMLPKPSKFSFWKTFAYIFSVTLVLFTIFFGLIGSYEEGFSESFVGIIMLSFILAIILTFFIKWWKDYKSTGKLISEDPTIKVEESGVKPGIRGWLILVAIGVVFSPLLILLALFTEFLPIFTDGSWELLTNPNSAYYIPGIGALLKFEIIGNILFFVLALYSLFLFFKKDKRFPKFFIALLAYSVLFSILDSIFASSIPGLDEQLNLEGDKELIRSIIVTAIWIPYMLKSRLVKVTFVK